MERQAAVSESVHFKQANCATSLCSIDKISEMEQGAFSVPDIPGNLQAVSKDRNK